MRGIKVYHTNSPFLSVSQFTIKQILNMVGEELLRDKVVGVIGCGKIGEEVIKILLKFGVKIYVVDKGDDLDDLLANSDIITLHASAKERILGRQEFMKMKYGVYIVNTARSHLIDEDMLYWALNHGKVKAAALDVWEDVRLKECKNALLTDHIASCAERERMEREAVDNLLEGLCVS